MHQDHSFQCPSNVNSSLLNLSYISCNKTGIIQTKHLADNYQEPKDQSTLIARNISYFNTSKIQPFNNTLQINHQIHHSNFYDQSFSNNSADLNSNSNNKQGLELNVSKGYLKPIENQKIINQREEQSSYDEISQLNETITVIDQFGIEKKIPVFDQSSIRIQVFNENSHTQTQLKRILEKINSQPSIDKARVLVSKEKELTLSNHSNTIITPKKNLPSLLELLREQVSVAQQNSENIIYDDRGPDDFIQSLKIDDKKIDKQKFDVYTRRKLIKEKQLSIISRLQRAEKSDSQIPNKKQFYIKQKSLVENFPKNQQNLKVMNEMFCHNQNAIKKRYRSVPVRYYMAFYIDEREPFYNRYILDLSIYTNAKIFLRLKQVERMKQECYQDLQKQKEQKMGKKYQHQIKQQDSQEFQNLQVTEEKQITQNNLAEQITERRKYVQERNRKKKEKKIEWKKQKQEKLEKQYGCVKQELLKFNVSMKLLTKVVWEHVVYLRMNKSQVVDKDFKYFVDKAQMFPNLMRMNFSQNQITDDGFTYFILNSHKFENVFDIFFGNNKITNQGIKSLSSSLTDFFFYKRIHLSENLIDDEGFKSFFSKGANYPSLIQISFGGNEHLHKPMTCHGFKVFAQNLSLFRGLRKIYLSKNLISDQGLTQFSNGMHCLTLLTEINLTSNKITSTGFDYFLSKIYQLPQIKKISFRKNNIQKIPKEQLKYLIKQPNKLLLIDLSKVSHKNKELNPFEEDEVQRIFLMDVFLNMKFKFKLKMNLYFPQNLILQKVGCDIQKLITIINGTFKNVFKQEHQEQAEDQIAMEESQQKPESKAKEKQYQIRVNRLKFLNLSQRNVTSQHWVQIVRNINNLSALQELNLNDNKIDTIKIDQLRQIQQHVIKRLKRQSRILKISLLDNKLDKQALEALNYFIKHTSDRRVFVITSMKNQLQQKQNLQDSVIFHEQKAYQQRKFKVVIRSNLYSGIIDTLIGKQYKKSQAQLLFTAMLKSITLLCGNQISNYEKVKNMFYKLHQQLLTDRVYPTKKNLIDKMWKIIESYFLTQIQKWCESINKKQNCFDFDETQMKSVLEQLSKVKAEKQKTKAKSKVT